MTRLAVMTIGVLHEPYDHPRVQGFVQRTGATFAAAAASEGYVVLVDEVDTTYNQTAGLHAVPAQFQQSEYRDRVPDTLSVWQDLESLFAFAYHGTHAEALGHRRDWFMAGPHTSHVAWWVADDHTPTWEEAAARYELLQRTGPSPGAFELKHPFTPDGQPTRVDQDAVRAKGARNRPPP